MSKTRADEIKSFLLKVVGQHPQDLVDQAIEKFGVTRTTVHRHLNGLIDEGQILKIGKKRGTRYYTAGALNQRLLFNLKDHPQEHKVWDQYFEPSFKHLPKNIFDVCYYGFGEMFNNAVDHSEGTAIGTGFSIDTEKVLIEVWDNGVGIFKKIQDFLHLEDIRESALQLSKGKLTTAPEAHSGEGIFFTSRAFDEYSLLANDLMYDRDNSREDWFIEDRESNRAEGTLVILKIELNSDRVLAEVFAEYQNAETYAFDKTHIMVKFSQLEDEKFVSRSQAKRILQGLERFNHIILDFEGVTAVGQAFVDEIFRVFAESHPEVTIEYINAQGAAEFMIKRGVATAQLNSSRSGR